ncbi:MAG: YicC family protein [Proteobacteria bacterium]|nr:YicC family protein [Pseudomonadota bacterium]
MIFSMTAFARCIHDGTAGRYTWEIRSVNHRYAETFLRMPEDFRSLESDLRASLLKRLNRGKIDCNLRVESKATLDKIKVNEGAARSVIDAARSIQKIAGTSAELDPFEVLKWPGVLDVESDDSDLISQEIRYAFEIALDQLVETRQREGEKLGQLVSDRCNGVADQISILRTRLPEIIQLTLERHQRRIEEYAQDFDKSRIEQECALLMQKLDIAEELDRLEAHLGEVRRVLKHGSPAGRRLDFLMQELNREANTVGSKSSHIDSSSASVELKVLIEQMREQIQNIE